MPKKENICSWWLMRALYSKSGLDWMVLTVRMFTEANTDIVLPYIAIGQSDVSFLIGHYALCMKGRTMGVRSNLLRFCAYRFNYNYNNNSQKN